MQDIMAAAQASFVAALPTPSVAAATLCAVVAAAILKGFTGFGFALAAVPLLGLFMAPSKAVPIALVLQLLSGLNDLRRVRKDCHWPSLRWLIIGTVVASPVGALILSVLPAAVARIAISVFISAAVILLNRGFRLHHVPSRPVTAAVGAAAGILNGLAAMSGPPVVVYYLSGPFRAVAARASLLIFFLAASVSALAGDIAVGIVTADIFWLSVLVFPAMLLGTWIGEVGFRRGSEALHRRVSIVSLGVVALLSAAKGVSELI